MKDSEIIKQHKYIDSKLDDYRITEAINTLKALLEKSRDNSLINKLGHIEETYNYMFQYMINSGKDDSRDSICSDIVESLRNLNDQVLRTVVGVDSPEYYYSLMRFNNLRNERLSDILTRYGNLVSEMSLAELGGHDVSELRKQKEELLVRLFNSIFTSLGAERDYKDLTSYLNSGYADHNVIALSLSALTLGLLYFYDKGKFTALLEIYEKTENERIAARALVGIIFAMVNNGTRIKADNNLMQRMLLWNDSIGTYRRLHEVIRVIIGTRDTERVAAKMKEEVIPELLKIRPDIMRTLNESAGSELDASMLENNPEWEKILENSNLTQKMQELTEMQSNGADLMMVTFSNLKQFPFFSTAANWFLPFDIDHTEIKLPAELKKIAESMHLYALSICDSDMYSLVLAMASMPDSQRNLMMGQITSQIDHLEQIKSDAVDKSSTPEFDTETLKVVRDLYRFFKLFRKREGLNDPFLRPLPFTELPVVGEMMNESEMLKLIGEFYFSRGYYADALPILELIEKTEVLDNTLWEKIGFCLQHAGRFAEACDAYEKAALLKNPGDWLTKKLAYVNRRIGNYDKAAEYYGRALEMDPENVTLIVNYGNMLLEVNDVSGSLAQFYHAAYLKPDDLKIMRGIAWLELLNGNFTKSSDYYSRILQSETTGADYLNAGHAALLMNNFKEALNYYSLAAEINRTEFELGINSDISTLIGLGADKTVIRLLTDKVMG